VDTDTDIPGQAVDLSVLKTASDNSVNTGDQVTFTITVKNSGPSDATGVEVKDTKTAEFSYVSDNPSKGTYDRNTNIWTVGDLANGETATLDITVKATKPGNYKNQVAVTAMGIYADTNPANNNAETKVSVKDDDPGPKPITNPFLIPVTGFQPGVVTDLSRVPHETYLATAEVTLEIPSLGVKIPIVGVPKKDGTWNVAWLGNEAGWLEGSAFPSWKGNSVLTGHVYLYNGKPGPFAKLIDLQYGDKVIVHAYGQKYTFVVQTNMAVKPNDSSVMKHEETPWLTLITCRDYDAKNDTYINRTVVRAALLTIDEE
jgi:LPXTG-site transpeptidase (sortase) family protein